MKPNLTKHAKEVTRSARRSRSNIHSGATKAKGEKPRFSVREVTRYIATPVQCMLWGKAGGRCQFSGHNKVLWRSSVTQEPVSIAQKAHIYAFSEGGPRHNAELTDVEINSLPNLILVCHECHEKIDLRKDGGRYSAAILREWKRLHEERVELVTGVCANKKSHILLYGANVGDHSAPLNYEEAALAMFPERYPAAANAIELSTINSSFSERDSVFWKNESENLRRKFNQRIRERLADGSVQHLSVFAIAPQPLLILLGSLLNDIIPADVFQRHREPATWNWPTVAVTPTFEVLEPTTTTGPPALVLSLSASITPERIFAVLGQDASIWKVTVPDPHNDVIKSRDQLSQLRTILRSVLDRIKSVHGQTSPLHIFPAAPVAVAIELGRIRMPKADMPWHIYDQVNSLGGFTASLIIPDGEA